MNPLFAASRAVLLRLSRAGRIGGLVERTAWGRRSVQRFVAGDTIAAAVATAVQLRDRGLLVTLDRLGEASTGARADEYAADAVALLRAQAAAGLEPNVSVKLTAMGLAEGRAAAASRLERVLAAAGGVHGFVRVDAEHAESLDDLHAIVLAARAAGHPVGTVLQANMRRSGADAARLVAAGVPLRLVKGAYDPGSEGVGDAAAVDRAYLALAASLLDSGIPLALATHDDSILDDLAPRARGSAEAQLLYGVRSDLAERLRAEGWRVRIYTPYGRDWWPYALRRMAERPANLRFVLRSLIAR